MEESTKSVIVIGAGLSGLSAAEEILRACPKTNVVVLEANNRVGGRTYSKELHGTFSDMGGMWVGPHQKYVIQLAKKARQSFIKQDCNGIKILELNGRIGTYTSKIPRGVPIVGLIQLQYYTWKIDRMARTVPLQNPGKCPNAIEWDSMTVYTWVQNHIYFDKIKKLVEAAVRAIFGAQPSEISFLFFLWYVHQSKSFNNLVEIEGGNQDRKLIFGSQYLSNQLSEEIQKQGGRVVLSSPVKKVIRQERIEVVTEQKSYFCDYLIVAMPPVSVQRIQFTPKLSKQRQFICQKNFMGSIIKILVFYQTKFWKLKKFSGQTLSDCLDSPVFNAYDDSRPLKNGHEQPAIVVFVNAAISRHWGNLQSMQQRTIQKLAEYFGKQALNPIDVHIQNWDDEPYIRGGPVANFPPGTLSQVGNITTPENNIHWAGTELAYHSQGFMDGAIQSGQRAAKEVIVQLKKVGEQYVQLENIDEQQPLIPKPSSKGLIRGLFRITKQLGGKIFRRNKKGNEVPYKDNITSQKRWYNMFI